ncbi:uncharacterized protein N7458_007670 [Penicillium daleae]|uniref:Uncharacterized protein n=1 Tax=Penicillium daleae TaxID=63821 RepID=A0AAD6C3Y4_9EURO|nr:uncharacterized protein N7458_007670 [Penicillium daleae]KAJ5443798.1 hypothetical protein N7458_007670 [Penicillium daleae]
MQLQTIFTALCLSLLSGTVTAQSQPPMNLTPTQSPSRSAFPSPNSVVPASRSATPTITRVRQAFRGSSTPASSVRVASTPAASSGFATSAIPAASGAANSNVLGNLLHLPRN